MSIETTENPHTQSQVVSPKRLRFRVVKRRHAHARWSTNTVRRTTVFPFFDRYLVLQTIYQAVEIHAIGINGGPLPITVSSLIIVS